MKNQTGKEEKERKILTSMKTRKKEKRNELPPRSLFTVFLNGIYCHEMDIVISSSQNK